MEGGDTLLQKSSNNINAKTKHTLFSLGYAFAGSNIVQPAYSQFAGEVQGAEKSASYQRREE